MVVEVVVVVVVVAAAAASSSRIQGSGRVVLGFSPRGSQTGLPLRVPGLELSIRFMRFLLWKQNSPKGTIREPSGRDYGKFYRHDLKFVHRVRWGPW